MKRFRLRTIKGRMLCAMLALGIVPLVLLGIISYQVSENAISRQVEEIHRYNINTYARNIQFAFDNLRQSADDFLYGKGEYSTGQIIAMMRKEPDYYNTLSYYQQAKIKKLFNNQTYLMMPHSIQSQRIVLESTNGLRFEKRYADGLEWVDVDIRNEDEEYKELYEEALERSEKEIFCRAGEDSFLYMKVIYELKNLRPIGYLVIEVDCDLFQTILPAVNEMENAAYVVVDTYQKDDPQIVFSSGNMENLEAIIRQYYAGEAERKQTVKTGQTTEETSGWDILYLIDKKALSKNAFPISQATIGFLILSAGIVFLFGVWLSRLINRPLEKLSCAIKKVGEDGAYIIEERFGDDEIGRIGNQFKIMVEQNLSLKDRLYQAEIRKKEAELIALQAQINPHFLYNTLDAIYLMTQMGRTKDAGKMILSLSEIFKTSLNKGQEFTKVKNEVSHIQHYLYIQKMRYGDKLNYEISISEDILEEKMLKLILQPIIENGIYHGLEPKVSGGFLMISGERDNDELVFVIKDNGAGMAHEEWKKGYGLTNVRQRIRLYYGEEYDLQVSSTVGEGTSVTVRLPLDDRQDLWV